MITDYHLLFYMVVQNKKLKQYYLIINNERLSKVLPYNIIIPLFKNNYELVYIMKLLHFHENHND